MLQVTITIVRVGGMPWPLNRGNSLPCTVKTSRQRSCNPRVCCLLDVTYIIIFYFYFSLDTYSLVSSSLSQKFFPSGKIFIFIIYLRYIIFSFLHNLFCFIVYQRLRSQDLRALYSNEYGRAQKQPKTIARLYKNVIA